MRGVSGHGDASDERLPISEIPQSRHVVRVAEQWFPTTGGLDAVMPDGQVVTRDGRLIHHDVARVRSLAEESREQLMARAGVSDPGLWRPAADENKGAPSTSGRRSPAAPPVRAGRDARP